MNIIQTHAGFERRFWVDVECSDPYWEHDLKRIEVHRDVAHHIFNQTEVIKDLQEQVNDAQVK
jgi:hypothetical protein